MTKFKSHLVFTILIGVTTLITATDAYSQTSDVRVVNPANNPVQTKIVNTSSAPVQTKIVNAANAPVPVTGNVNIGNTAANPVLVRVVDEGAREPFQKSLSTNGSTFNVPVGKRLVIEFASAHIAVLEGIKVMNIRIATKLSPSSPAQTHFLVANFEGTQTPFQIGQPSSDRFSASQQMRVYAGPETEVKISFDTSQATSILFSTVTISGYYEKVPAASSSSPNSTATSAVGETDNEALNN